MGLPEWETVKEILDDNEDLAGTAVCTRPALIFLR